MSYDYFAYCRAVRDSDLHPHVRHVLLTLALRCGQEGKGYTSQERLAKDVGKPVRCVQRYLAEARGLGWVSWTRGSAGAKRANEYYLHDSNGVSLHDSNGVPYPLRAIPKNKRPTVYGNKTLSDLLAQHGLTWTDEWNTAAKGKTVGQVKAALAKGINQPHLLSSLNDSSRNQTPP